MDELFKALQKELVSWCSKMTGNAALAEDLVQEGFLCALVNISLLESLNFSQQRAWLYRTIKNRYIDRRRHASFETVMEELPEEAGEAEGYARIDNRELLSALHEEERIVFVLRYLEGYNSAEIGKMLGLPPGTVRSRLSTARRRLRQML